MTAVSPPVSVPTTSGRRVKIWQYLVAVLGYLVIVQGLTIALASSGSGHDTVGSVDSLVRSVVVPVGVGAAYVVAIVAWHGGWQRLFVVPRLRRWTLLLVALLFVGIVAVTNYGGLAEVGLLHALVLLVAVLLVGFAEELLFRGIGVDAFRSAGHRERSIAIWTSVIFGIAHGSNAAITGDVPAALLQVLLTTLTGALFYVVLRSTGMLVAGMAAHGLWDFGILSTQVIPSDPHDLVNAAPVLVVVILLTVVIRRRRLTDVGSPAPQ